jgi:hypothetical protein
LILNRFIADIAALLKAMEENVEKVISLSGKRSSNGRGFWDKASSV